MAKSKRDFSQQVSGVLGSALTPELEPEDQDTVTPPPTRRFGASSVKELSSLSTQETEQLALLEATIERGLHTFLEVGRALIEIQENRLYRATHLTLEQYMQDRFSLNRNRGYQLIDAAKVVNQIAEEIKPALVETAEETGEAENGSLQAVPTGKIRRPKPSTSVGQQPQDIDYTEQIQKESTSEETELDEAAAGELSSESSGESSPVASADEEGGRDAQPQNKEISGSIPLPATESHAAALVQLPEDKRTEVWKKTVAESQEDGKPITASRIKKTAEQGGVPLNKKAPKDRKPPKNAFGRDPDPDDDFSESALDHTRKAMNGATWLSQDNKKSNGDDLTEENPVEFGNDETEQTHFSPAPAGSRQALSEALIEKIFQALPGDVMITLQGSFLIREGISEGWQTLRGDDRPIDEQYSDTMTIQEFWELIGAKRP